MCLARPRWPPRDDLARLGVAQEAVLVRRRLLLPALVFLVLGGLARALAAAFGAIDSQVESAGQSQRARLDLVRVTLRTQRNVSE